jgi:hypothetical protein
MPVIDQLRHEVPASTILAPLWASSGLEATDASVVDISDLTPQESLDVQDFAWVELPLLGGDGRITGVLCQRSGIAVPCVHAAHGGDEAVRVYVHDIANLLAVIDGGLRLLDAKTGDDRATILERLHRAIERGATMSRRLLDAARPESKPRAPASHEKIVVDLSDLLDRTLRPDVVVDTVIDPGLRQFSVDPEALHLALLNLCKNASDAMPDGGTISISARTSVLGPTARGWRSPSPTTESAWRRKCFHALSSPTSQRRMPARELASGWIR